MVSFMKFKKLITKTIKHPSYQYFFFFSISVTDFFPGQF